MNVRSVLIGLALLVAGCGQIPDGVQAVKGFDADRSLGKWYEVARLENSFERGLTKISATYSRREGGGIEVVNRGFDAAKGEWREARGRGKFSGNWATGESRFGMEMVTKAGRSKPPSNALS